MPHYQIERGSIQHGFQMSRAKIQIFGGGYGNGKTTAMAVKALRLAKDYPGCNGLLARSTYPKLNDTLRAVFFKWCPPHWIKKRPTQEDNTCYLHNGSIINFRYIAQRGKSTSDGHTTSNLLSATYDWFGVDQIEDPEITHKDLLDLFGRLRGNTPYRPDAGEDDETMPSTGPRWAMLAANPTHGWFYKEIVQPYIQFKKHGIISDKLLVGGDGLPLIELFEGSTYTNARNLEPDYIQLLESSYTGQSRKRYLDGEWAAFEGLVHPSYETGRTTLKREEVDMLLETYRQRGVKLEVLEMYDFGLTSPSCYMLAVVDDYGRVIVIDGFYQGDFSYEDQPEAIFDIRQKYMGLIDYPKEPIIADPAIFKKTVIAKRRTGESVAKLLTDGGLKLRPGQNDIAAGIAKVNAYFSGHPKVPHVLTGNRPGPLLYICEDLTWFDTEITSYFWKRNPFGQQIDEPQDHNDHAMNALKYGLSYRPKPAEIVVPDEKKLPPWAFWHEEPDSAHA